MKSLRLVSFLCLLAAPLPALADHTGCDNPLPHVLNLGLPRLPRAGFELHDLKEGVERFMAGFYQEHGRCPGERQLQVNITVASDYELLDWLSQGAIHAAVIPDMTLYLLNRDGFDLRKVDVRGHRMGDLLLPAVVGVPVSAEAVNGKLRARPSAQKDLQAFHEQIWSASGEISGEKRTEEYRIVLASHLSTTGFLDPLLATNLWLAPRLRGIADTKEREDRRERFWQAFFDHARFTLDCDSLSLEPEAGARSCWELPKSGQAAGPVEILFPCEMSLRPKPGEMKAIAAGGGYREHLVILGTQADEIFPKAGADGEAFRDALPTYGAELDAVFADRKNELPDPERRLLKPFQAILEPEPLFGIRTFGFTVDETVRLLRQDQTTSGRAALALVLPGGGVKAAYQSRIVDELYSRRYLENFKVTDSREPLEVQYVIGTSGGALLGFFVSQLGETGPWNLTDILWKRDVKKGLYLRSSDVFGWTDLLRYLSVVVSFLVLCALLALVSIPEQAPLNPANREGTTAWRGRLTLAVFPLLLTAPLLVRLSNARSAMAQEQIPEFEGLIYAVLGMIAMFADQCLVLQEEPRENGRPWAPPWLPVLAGGALVAVPLLSDPAGWSSRGLSFGPAYAVLAPLVLLAGLILPLRIRSSRTSLPRVVLETLVPTGLALLLGLGLSGDWLSAVKVPFYITGFGLVLLLVFANSLLRRMRLQGRTWWAAYAGSLFLASFLVMNLCWPGESKENALAAHTLEISIGTFLVCVGLLVLLLGGIAWAYAAQRRYHVERTQDFLAGFVVVLTHMVTVAVILWVVTEVLPDRLSPLELTGEFWTWLLATSSLAALALLLAALYGRRDRSVVKLLRRSFLFLCSHHPNGEFVTRRFVRLAALSVFSLAWWNMIVAPALYGNRQARAYLAGAVERFYDEAGIEGRHYRPTSHFIAPANVLERDGTRYFLFVPEDAECPPVPRQPSNGAIWYPFSMGAPTGECKAVEEPRFPEGVIFASGSPFPIFPAHRLKLEDKDVALVDGGYSNNIPVDAARTVAAEQVLIVESTNPLKTTAEPSRFAQAVLGVRGKLVENLGRLPGFLFERSQQVDRLSRRDLFVVSISPSREEKNWPPLFDFRRQTVQRMEKVATDDLKRRVGMVQSWGRPSFVLSVEVLGKPRKEEAPHEHSDGAAHPHV
ncbi:MAG TPA: hypothetical protein VF179_12795 [Thermoanaerobaculia bacterium]|nr:hypothetical protein [Thermoanaerobaculia bacterium]